MTEKYASIASYVVIILLAIVYITTANGFRVESSNTVGPDYLPKLLGYGLIIFSVIGLIVSLLQKESKKIIIPNLKMILVSIVVTIVFLVTWYFLKMFYVLSFCFLVGLSWIFRKELGFGKKNIMTILGSALLIVIILYLLFDRLMGIQL